MSGKKLKTPKGKKSVAAKLKSILANPYQTLCPMLKDEELQKLKDLLQSAMEKSQEKPLVFAKQHEIRLGLESTLRAIKNRKCACVLLSHNIKPRYILGLIVRNIDVIDETIPVFTHVKMEEFCESVFGIRTLALVIPKSEAVSKEIAGDMHKWLLSNQRPLQTPKTAAKKVKKPRQIVSTSSSIELSEEAYPTVSKDECIAENTKRIAKKSDFISFSNTTSDMDVDNLDLEDEEKCLVDALEKLKKKVKIGSAAAAETKTADFICAKKGNMESHHLKKELQAFQPLTVYKLAPNPRKIKK